MAPSALALIAHAEYNQRMEVSVREIEVRSVLTPSNLPVADYSVNPYAGCAHGCMYCYASFMKRFTGHAEPWGSFVDVKHWPEIRNAQRFAGKELFIGSVTDPYQPLEAQYGRTRALLESLQGSGCRISIATKSDLVLRDLDLIRTFPDARVSWSVNTLDENFRKDMDDAVSIERRLEAMRIFHEAGVRTTCFISPIFPGITDPEEIIIRAEHQCNLIWLENLNLRGGFRKNVMDYIASKHPELTALYEDIYIRGNRRYWLELDQRMREFTERSGLPYLRNDDSMKRAFSDPPAVVNYFFHEEIIPSARKAHDAEASIKVEK